MSAHRDSFEFGLDIFYRLERTKRPSTSIAVYAELLAAMVAQNNTTISCEVRFLSTNLKMGTHTVTETLNEFRRMGLIKFIPSKRGGNTRLIEMVSEEK